MNRFIVMAVAAVMLAAGAAARAAEKEAPIVPAPAKSKTTSVFKPKLLPPDETVVLPKELRESAAKAFKEGYKYFIWFDGQEPFQVGSSKSIHLVAIPILYVSNGDPLPFIDSVTVFKKDDQMVLGSEMSRMRGRASSYSTKGKTRAMFFRYKRHYRGKGVANISLHELTPLGLSKDETTKKQISNEIQVQLEYQ